MAGELNGTIGLLFLIKVGLVIYFNLGLAEHYKYENPQQKYSYALIPVALVTACNQLSLEQTEDKKAAKGCPGYSLVVQMLIFNALWVYVLQTGFYGTMYAFLWANMLIDLYFSRRFFMHCGKKLCITGSLKKEYEHAKLCKKQQQKSEEELEELRLLKDYNVIRCGRQVNPNTLTDQQQKLLNVVNFYEQAMVKAIMGQPLSKIEWKNQANFNNQIVQVIKVQEQAQIQAVKAATQAAYAPAGLPGMDEQAAAMQQQMLILQQQQMQMQQQQPQQMMQPMQPMQPEGGVYMGPPAGAQPDGKPGQNDFSYGQPVIGQSYQ